MMLQGCTLEHPQSTNGHALALADPEPRWRITPLGLEAPDDLTYEELYHLGFALGRMERGIAWAIGEWWLRVDRAQFTLGDRANELQHATGLDYQTLRCPAGGTTSPSPTTPRWRSSPPPSRTAGWTWPSGRA
jgi:hypothetical protein